MSEATRYRLFRKDRADVATFASPVLDNECVMVDAADYDALADLADRLKQEALIHAQEARTANATIADIYQVVTGRKGELGNWNGAEPVRKLIVERDAEIEKWSGTAVQNGMECDRLAARVAELEKVLENASATLERAVSPADETPEAVIESAMAIIDDALVAHRQAQGGDA